MQTEDLQQVIEDAFEKRDQVSPTTSGVVRDAVKEELSYGDATRVRWRSAPTRAAAESMAEEYR